MRWLLSPSRLLMFDDPETAELDEPELLMLAYVEEMEKHGIAPSEMISFAVETIMAAVAGQYDTHH